MGLTFECLFDKVAIIFRVASIVGDGIKDDRRDIIYLSVVGNHNACIDAIAIDTCSIQAII